MSAGNAPGRREVAHRLFAAEFDDADLSYSESDEERAPNYVVVPSGARVNRLFFVGVLTETERVNEDMLRARIVDPSGAFVTYAGQYQPDEFAFLERADPPAYLAVTGKARTFQPEDSDRVFTSVRPESISEVDAETRDRWVVQAAERTVERVETAAAAIDSGLSGDALREALEAEGVDPSLAAGIPIALDHYATTPAYLAGLRELAEDALAMVAGEVDEVGSFDLAPDEGTGDAAPLASPDVTLGAPETAAEAGGQDGETGPSDTRADTTARTDSDEAEAGTVDRAEAETSAETAAATAGDEAASADAESTTGDGVDADAPSGPDDEDEIGDFEPTADTEAGEAEPEPESAADVEVGGDDLGDEAFDPEEDDALSEAERQEVEEEHGTDFSTGNEVGEPGEADVGEPSAQAEEEESVPDERTGDADPDAESADNGEASADVPLDEAVMDAMRELDEGDGAERDAIVEAVGERTGASPDEVDAAIQDALMSGQCYEPDDDLFKPI